MKLSAIVLVCLAALSACDLPTAIPPEEAEAVLFSSPDLSLRNSEMEDSYGWFFRRPEGMTAGYVEGEGLDGGRAVKLTGTSGASPESFAFAGQSLAVGDLTGYTLTLTAQIRLVDVKGQGVSVALRGDDLSLPSGGIAEAFASTQGSVTIRGTTQWVSYSVDLKNIDPSIGKITAYVILLPETTGTVFVDNVSLRSAFTGPFTALGNGSFEMGATATTPDFWTRGGTSTSLAGFSLDWQNLGAVDGGRTVSITRAQSSQTEHAYWTQTVRPDAFRDGPVTLRARVRTELVGDGVSLVIRGDDSSSWLGLPETYETSQFATPITGSSGWVERSVRVERLPANTKTLTVYLIFLPRTTGTAYFDGVTLKRE